MICISVQAGRASEFLKRSERAFNTAALVELRFDSIIPEELPQALAGLSELRKNYRGLIIGTFRSSENGQGGLRLLTDSERKDFWKSEQVRAIVDWVDIEYDLDPACLRTNGEWAFRRVIRSFHDFEGVPDRSELGRLIDRLIESAPDGVDSVVKIACTPSDLADSVAVWDLYTLPMPVIATAMGEFGAWTRILGPSKGAPVTYSSLDDADPTAPGQITFEKLKSVFRIDGIGDYTGIYGIVGRSAAHSLSPLIHNAAFRESGVDSVYLPLPVVDARTFYKDMVSPKTRLIDWNLQGFSVTIPHKEIIAELVDDLEGAADSIKAVNTVRIRNGRVSGFNTDADGFLAPLKNRRFDLRNSEVGIIGTGGAAKAAAYALVAEGANVTFISRDPRSATETAERYHARLLTLDSHPSAFSRLDILVNASPVGSKAVLEAQSPVKPEVLKNLHLAYDMVYNPKSTRFLRDAEEAGIPTIGGLEMLIEQAVLQFEIWTGENAPKEAMLSSVIDLF